MTTTADRTGPQTRRRAAIYARLSSDPNMTRAAVKRQTEDSRTMARIKGYEVAEVFEDNDTSASRKGVVRPDFEAMLKRIAAGEFQSIIVWHLDRLARKMSDLMKVIEAGQPHKLNIIAVEGISLDLSDPTGVAVAQILVAIAGMEVAHKGNRQKAANRDRAEQGLPFASGRTYGYERDGSIRESEAVFVRRLFDMYTAGQAIVGLTKFMQDSGQVSTTGRTGAKGMSRSGIRSILANPRYVGQIRYRGELMSEAGPAIIDRDTFDAAQSMLSEKSAFSPTLGKRKHLGVGVYRCGICAEPMVSSGTGWRKATGEAVFKYTYTCPGHMSRIGENIDRTVEAFMTSVLDDPDIRARFAGDRDNQEMQTLRKRASALRAFQAKLSDRWAKGQLDPSDPDGITDGQFTRQNTVVRDELATVSGALADIGSRSALSSILSADDPAKVWMTHPDLMTRVRVLDELLSVTVRAPQNRGHQGAFDPDSVCITLKAGPNG